MSELDAVGTRPRLGTTALVYVALAAVIVISTAVVGAQGGNLLSRANLVDMLTRSSLLGFIAPASSCADRWTCPSAT